jgi:hypothetical protein
MRTIEIIIGNIDYKNILITRIYVCSNIITNKMLLKTLKLGPNAKVFGV